MSHLPHPPSQHPFLQINFMLTALLVTAATGSVTVVRDAEFDLNWKFFRGDVPNDGNNPACPAVRIARND
jgi:hypothetical protein